MKVDIQAQDFTVTDGIRQAILQACSRFLRHHADLISQVSVHMADINGTRGGEDKLCRVAIKVRRGPTIVSSQVSSDLYDAIRTAVAKVGRGADAKVGRRRGRFANMRRQFQRSSYGVA